MADFPDPVLVDRQRQLEEQFQLALQQKERMRRHLMELPFEEKYKMMQAMQRRSAAILATRGITKRIWPDLRSGYALRLT